MPRTSRHRQNLIESAVRLFRRQGFASTGLNQILADCGAPRGSLYHYFPGGKEQLGAESVRFAGQVVTRTLEALARAHDTPEAFVTAYANLLAGWMEDSEFRSGCPIATTLLETTPQSRLIADAAREVFAEWTEVLATALSAEGHETRSEEAGPDVDQPDRSPLGEAQFLISTIEGALLLARVHESSAPIKDAARHFLAGRARSPPFES